MLAYIAFGSLLEFVIIIAVFWGGWFKVFLTITEVVVKFPNHLLACHNGSNRIAQLERKWSFELLFYYLKT